MYSHTFFVTSVRAIDFPPQISANAGLRDFFANRPLPAFFIAKAFFLLAAEMFFFDFPPQIS